MGGTELSIDEANKRVDDATEILNNILKQMGDANDHLLSLKEQQAFLGTSGSNYQRAGEELFEHGTRVTNDGYNLMNSARHAAMGIDGADNG